MSSSRTAAQERLDAHHAVLEREMRRLVVLGRLLGAALCALCARILTSGAAVAEVLSAGIILALLLAALLLIRHGHRHEPPLRRDR